MAKVQKIQKNLIYKGIFGYNSTLMDIKNTIFEYYIIYFLLYRSAEFVFANQVKDTVMVPSY